jgi:hypothetical protein
MEPNPSGPCDEHKETPTNPRCAECGWPEHRHPTTKGTTVSNDDKRNDSYVLEPEDYFCGLGLVLGFGVQIAAAWANPGVANSLLSGGQSAAIAFFIAWIVCKCVRGRNKF